MEICNKIISSKYFYPCLRANKHGLRVVSIRRIRVNVQPHRSRLKGACCSASVNMIHDRFVTDVGYRRVAKVKSGYGGVQYGYILYPYMLISSYVHPFTCEVIGIQDSSRKDSVDYMRIRTDLHNRTHKR